MTAALADTQPLDAPRALAAAAMISHIDALLDPAADRCTLRGARLLAQISQADPQAVETRDQLLTMRLYGIRASAHHDTVALLRRWQHAARLRLEAGVR